MGKARYITLDALRGLAALFVVARHVSDRFGLSYPQFSFLAVDLFFGLSGFVLAYRYDNDEGRGLGVRRFMTLRIIRLYPFYLLGLLIALKTSLPYIITLHGIGVGLATLGSAALMMPSPTWSYETAAFPLLLPAWSLFFEMFVANFAFALLMGRAKPRILLLIVCISAVCLILVAATKSEGFDIGPLWRDFAGGVPRTCFSFFVGVLLCRLRLRSQLFSDVPSWAVLMVFAALMLVEVRGPAAWFVAATYVFVALPLLVFVGAGAKERMPVLGMVLGEASYGIYTLHYPLIGPYFRFEERVGLPHGEVNIWIFPILVAALALPLAIGDLKLRRWLLRRLMPRQNRQSVAE